MSEMEIYQLEILFDATAFAIEQDLENLIRTTLSEHSNSITLAVTSNKKKTAYILSLKGSDEVIDNCHKKLNKLILDTKYKCIRQKDTLGDMLRAKVYPIIAETEQRLREFVNKALVEIYGVDWWNSLHFEALEPDLQKQYNKQIKEQTGTLTPLELTQFDDLLDLITKEVSEWDDQKLLSVNDFLQLLVTANGSLDQLQVELANKLKKISLWDDVFSKYFENIKSWEKAKEFLTRMIEDRHRVMHHRYVDIGIIKRVTALKDKLLKIFLEAKEELPEEELNEARTSAVSWDRLALMELSNSLLESSRESRKALDNITHFQFSDVIKENQKAFLEFMKNFDPLAGVRENQKALDTIAHFPFSDIIKENQKALWASVRESQKALEVMQKFDFSASVRESQKALEAMTKFNFATSPDIFSKIISDTDNLGEDTDKDAEQDSESDQDTPDSQEPNQSENTY